MLAAFPAAGWWQQTKSGCCPGSWWEGPFSCLPAHLDLNDLYSTFKGLSWGITPGQTMFHSQPTPNPLVSIVSLSASLAFPVVMYWNPAGTRIGSQPSPFCLERALRDETVGCQISHPRVGTGPGFCFRDRVSCSPMGLKLTM